MRLERFNERWGEFIAFFRTLSQEIENNPNLHDTHAKHPLMREICHDRDSLCLDRVKMVEALSYGNPSVLLGAPGPSLSGMMLRDLGSLEQKNVFFDYVEAHSAKTFFAMTEPQKGSDATRLGSVLHKKNSDEYSLNAEKWLIGNGAVASTGIVLAKINSGPLGLTAVLLTPELLASQPDKQQREVLSTFFLKGAQLSHIKFTDFIVPETALLGLHLKPLQRGFMAMLKTFNRMRPCVAAFALGHAAALTDKIAGLFAVTHPLVRHLNEQIYALQHMLYDAAKKIEENPLKYGAASSMVKFKATRLVEMAARETLNTAGYHHLLTDPWLEQAVRDAYGFEFMEGTTHIQKINAFSGIIGGRNA